MDMNEQTLKLEKGTRVKALLLFYKSMIYFKRMCSGLSIARVVVKNKTSMKDTFFTSVFVVIGFIMAFPLFVLCNLIVDLFLNLKSGRSNICLRGKAVFISLCTVHFNKFELAIDVEKDKSIFYFPKQIKSISKKENIVFSSNIFSVPEILSIYRLVLLTYLLYIKRAVTDVPYVYKSLFFYRVYFLISKLDSTNRLYFCSERDEYCILYDLKTKFDKILVQHGICYREERSYCNLRYSNVNELYVSDRKYLNCYLNNYFGINPIVHDFKNRIILSDLNSGIPTVLIISCARLYNTNIRQFKILILLVVVLIMRILNCRIFVLLKI